MKNAMNFNGTKVSLESAKRFYRGMKVNETVSGGFDLMTEGEISSFGCRDRVEKIHLDIPSVLLPDIGGDVIWPLGSSVRKPYGRELTKRIAASVFHKDFDDTAYGIIPGKYYFEDGGIRFEAELDPLMDSVEAVLFYANRNMKSHASPNGLTCFNFGDTGFYGLVLPISRLVDIHAGNSIMSIRTSMAISLSNYLTRTGVMETIA